MKNDQNLLSWSEIDNNTLQILLSGKHEEWKQKQAVMNAMKQRKKYSCQDCDKIMNDNNEIESHMKETDFEHCMFDEI